MSETKPSSDVGPIQRFTKSLKLDPDAERIVSPGSMEYYEELRVLAWTVRWVLSVRCRAKPKRLRVEASVLARATTRQGKTFVLYRRHMLELLRWPKPAFDQLAIELPCLMGFRAKEVTTWRAEYIDWVNGETLVLDAKKHKLLLVPLSAQAAKHAEQVLAGRCEGLVLQSRSNRQQDPTRPLTPIAVWYIWNKYVKQICRTCPTAISPVWGRRWFAYEFYHRQPENLVELQVIMRHERPDTTLLYVRSLVCWEDVKRAYDRFQLGLMHEPLQGVTA